MEYQRSVRVLTNGGFCGKCGCETINLSVIRKNPSLSQSFYEAEMKNETTRNWLLPKKCWPFPSTTLAISEDFQFLASKRGNQAEKSKAHPHHPPPQRSHKLCLGVQFLLFLGSLQKVSLTLHFDGMISSFSLWR